MGLVITQEAFEAEVRRRVNEKGLPFIRAVYAVLEAYLEQCQKEFPVKLACEKGCSACCYQLVTCTEMEFNVIVAFVRSLPRPQRKAIKERARRMAEDWRNYFQQSQRAFEQDPLRLHRDWLGKPCPFLDEENGSCGVHPARPIDCRTFTSTIRCTRVRLYAQRMRFPPELWANNLILEEQGRKTGIMSTTPLLHWILAKGFGA